MTLLALSCLPIASAIFQTGPKDLPLSNLDLSHWEQEYGEPGVNRSVDGNPIRIGGKTFDHGIGSHASSRADLLVNGNAQRFRASVGIDDEVGGGASVRFIVLADGRVVFDSGVMQAGESKAVDVSLAGAKVVRFIVDDARDGITNDHADWGDPVLTLKDPSKRPSFVSPREEAVMSIAPVDLTHTTIHGPRVIGGTPGRPFLFRVPATGKGQLQFTFKGLPKGIEAKGPILRGAMPSVGRYPILVSVSGSKGTDTRTITLLSGAGKLVQTPPMGWNSWNVWGTAVTADKVRDAADAFVSLRLADFGYSYVNVDDAWEAGRDANGEIQTNEKFGDMGGLADYLHGLGLKLGVYSSPGRKTCGGYEGSLDHEAQDAATYAKWGVDYLKYDWCSYWDIYRGDDRAELMKPFSVMRKGLDAANRDIVYSLCQYGMGDVWKWGKEAGGDLWRTTGDINDTWSSMSSNGFAQADRGEDVGPGAWNDPDMLVVGRLGWGPALRQTRLTGNEQITHMTLWAMAAAPLLIGCDLSAMDEFTRRLLLNHDVIEIDQDALGKAAKRVYSNGDAEIWARPLADGSYAVALFNRGPAPLRVETNWARDLGSATPHRVRDLWRRKELGTKAKGYAVGLPSHGAVLLRVTRS